MSDLPPTVAEPLPASVLERVDRLCDEFEDAWQQGLRPRIEDFLGDTSGRERDELLRWLIPLDVKYRRQHEATPEIRDYLELSPTLSVDWLAGVIRPAMLLTERYLFGEKIGIGGIAEVHRGHDRWLDCPVAIKVLLEKYQHQPDMVRRFHNEARITSRLQHPGIVPVHDLGLSADGRPCFTMKLVQGRTLAALLTERTAPSQDLPRFLSIFEQICQALAYAHAQGVIHRDLKPQNVMVGAFGEVQVMDWGLAKVLKRSRAEDAAAGGDKVVYGPSEEDTSWQWRTQPGQAMGTYAYMPPEQARGEVERMDERSDVFGLGAILCEILTGQPPFTGAGDEILAKAKACDHAEALARLDGCGADADLLRLAKVCLMAEPEERPRNAGVVAEETKTYLTGLQELLQEAERERAAAEAQTREAKKTVAAETAKRWVMLWATVVVVLVTTAGLAATYWQYNNVIDQRDRAREHADELRRQVEHNRHALFNSQLLRVGLLWERDPFLGLRLLNDTDTCPPALRDFTWKMYYRLCDRKRLTIQVSSDGTSAHCLAITSDGRMIATGMTASFAPPEVAELTGEFAGMIKLWDAVSGCELAHLPGHAKFVSGLAFSSDGTLLASGSDDGTIIVWDVTNRKSLTKFQDGVVKYQDKRLQFTTDKRLLFVSYDTIPPKLWNLTTNTECVLPLTERERDEPNHFCLSPDGKLLAAGPFYDGTDRIWDLTTGREIHRFKHTQERHDFGHSMALAFSPDSRILASGLWHDGTLELRDVATGTILKRLWDGFDDVHYLTFTKDGRSLFAVGDQESAKLWNIASEEVEMCVRPILGSGDGVAISADGNTLVGYPGNPRTYGEFTVWDLTRRPLACNLTDSLEASEYPLCSNGTILALRSGRKGSLYYRNLTNGAKQKLVQGKDEASWHAALSLDGHRLVTIGTGDVIHVWELPSGKECAGLLNLPQTGRYHCPAISSDGRRIAFLRDVKDASVPFDQRQIIRELTVWDLEASCPCFTVKGAYPAQQLEDKFFLTFSPDGTMLAGKTCRSVVQLWDIEKATERISIPVEPGEGTAGTFGPDGKMLALSYGRTIRLWDLAKNRESSCLRGHTEVVLSLCFSPDGRTLASGSGDRTVRLWDVPYGLEHATLLGFKERVGCVAFSMDGRRLVASDGVGTTLVWEASSPAPFVN